MKNCCQLLTVLATSILYSGAIFSLNLNIGGAAGSINTTVTGTVGHVTTPQVGGVGRGVVGPVVTVPGANNPAIQVTVPKSLQHSTTASGSRILDQAIYVKTPEIHDAKVVNGAVYLMGPGNKQLLEVIAKEKTYIPIRTKLNSANIKNNAIVDLTLPTEEYANPVLFRLHTKPELITPIAAVIPHADAFIILPQEHAQDLMLGSFIQPDVYTPFAEIKPDLYLFGGAFHQKHFGILTVGVTPKVFTPIAAINAPINAILFKYANDGNFLALIAVTSQPSVDSANANVNTKVDAVLILAVNKPKFYKDINVKINKNVPTPVGNVNLPAAVNIATSTNSDEDLLKVNVATLPNMPTPIGKLATGAGAFLIIPGEKSDDPIVASAVVPASLVNTPIGDSNNIALVNANIPTSEGSTPLRAVALINPNLTSTPIGNLYNVEAVSLFSPNTETNQSPAVVNAISATVLSTPSATVVNSDLIKVTSNLDNLANPTTGTVVTTIGIIPSTNSDGGNTNGSNNGSGNNVGSNGPPGSANNFNDNINISQQTESGGSASFAIIPPELIASALSTNCHINQGILEVANNELQIDNNKDMCLLLQKIGVHNPQCDCKSDILR